ANAKDGVLIENGKDNVIGAVPGAPAGGPIPPGNLISGNKKSGVHITGTEATGNVVARNHNGTDKDRTRAVGNTENGVLIEGGAAKNTVGGATANERNLISANGTNGLAITGAQTTMNVVRSNYIGTQKDGMTPLTNGKEGVLLDGAPGNTV